LTIETLTVTGLAGRDGPAKAQPELEGYTTVRLPVTAIALDGTFWPVTCSVRAALLLNFPASPVPFLVSSSRTGLSESNVAPVSSAVK
jgi:hypothetical protein